MQIMHEHSFTLSKDFNMSLGHKASYQAVVEDKEKRSSEASLRTMNPVASGDNVATAYSSAHKLKEAPSLVPCCEGRELQINEDLVRSGLSAISVKHDSEMQCLKLSRASERLQIPPGLMKHRNSFRSLHRPDLKRVPYLRRMTPEELETVFSGYSDVPLRGKSENHELLTRSVTEPPVEVHNQEDALHPIPESRAGAEELPEGMRLHGARARLYTSVLAGAKAGDQLDATNASEVFDPMQLDEPADPEDEVQLREELQVLLPPRCDDVTESLITAASDNSQASS